MPLDYATPTARKPRDRRQLVHIAISIALPLMVLMVWFFAPGFLYQRLDEVDINSGRVRRSVYVCRILLYRKVEESVISKVLFENTPSATSPKWGLVYLAEPGGARYHPTYRGAISQMRGLEQLWQQVTFTDEAKREVSSSLLALWQTHGDYFAAMPRSSDRGVCETFRGSAACKDDAC